jgi:hypothetical protein
MGLRASGILAAIALAAASALPAAGPSALTATIERFDRLEVGEAVSVSGLRVGAGRISCLLKSGRAAPVRAGEEVVGLFFEGEGAMEYLSSDPIEAPVVLFDAKKASSLKTEKTDRGVVLRDSFRRMLWLEEGRQPLPEIAAAPASSLADPFQKQRAKFRRMHAPPLSHDFALHRLDAPEAPLVWAEMDGGREDLLYGLDGSDDAAEWLVTLAKSESNDPEMRKFLWLVPISHQLVGRDRRDPPRARFLLTDVDLELSASAGNDATLTVAETLVPVGRPARALRFDLDSTLYAQAGANLATRSERVRSVTDENGRALAFDHRLDELVVELAAAAEPAKPFRLRFEIEGDFLVRPRGDNYWELGVRPWFPQPPLAGQAYTFHALVRVRKPFVPFASGATVRRAEEGEENVLETRIENPVQFAVILAGRYDMEEETRDGVKIRVATYALDNPRGRKQLIRVAAEIIAYYTEFLGPFPFPEFNILEINDYGYGQAPPATMFITKEAFDPLLGDMDKFSSQGIVKMFAHEIAHQYWGIVVRIPEHGEQWLAESFAEYCAGLFLKDRRSEAGYRSLLKRWRTGADFAADAAPIALANRVWITGDALRRSEIRSGLLYDKGPVLLAALHEALGDKAFRAFLRSCQASFAWKFGSTKGIAQLLQARTATDYGPFFEKYYWGTEMPGR